MLLDKFGRIVEELISLREECSRYTEPDSYIHNTFDSIQDELSSLEVYVMEIVNRENDKVSRVLQKESGNNSQRCIRKIQRVLPRFLRQTRQARI
jgi:hypothetical protein